MECHFLSFVSFQVRSVCVNFYNGFLKKFSVTKKNVISSATNSGLKRMPPPNELFFVAIVVANMGILFICHIKVLFFFFFFFRWFLFFRPCRFHQYEWIVRNHEQKKLSCNTLNVLCTKRNILFQLMSP